MTCASTGNADSVRDLSRAAPTSTPGDLAESGCVDVGRVERHPNVVRCSSKPAPISGAYQEGIHRAPLRCREGDIDSVRQLLAAGVNVNIRFAPESRDEARAPTRAQRRTQRIRNGGRKPRAARAALPGDDLRRQHAAARRDDERARGAGVVPARSRAPIRTCSMPAFTPLHWASGTWEGGGRESGVRSSRADERHPESSSRRFALVKSLLAHGANPNAQMTQAAARLPGVGRRIRGRARRNTVPARQRGG
jgi:hypothetical protein